MALFKSSNPALKSDTFINVPRFGESTEVMTIQGTVNKVFLLTLMVFVVASLSWDYFLEVATQGGGNLPLVLGGASIGAFIVALLTIYNKKNAAYYAPIYASLQGVVMGVLSAFMEQMYPGIVIQAITLTFGVLFSLLALYRTKVIQATENFKLIVASATMGIAFFYLISMVAGFFGFEMPLIHSSGTFGIIFSLAVVVIAALNLVVDFDFIEEGAKRNAPKYMEWYAAFGLMVTLIWLYVEILRLLSKLQSRD